MTDAEVFRQESRDRWARSAAGWQVRREPLREATMPVSEWMVDAIDPQPGQDVLELAAGLGDTGFLAAELIAPTGTLICSDFVPEMLSAAQARAAELGITNVRFRQIDAEVSIDQRAATLDAVLCRWGLMLMAQPDTALQESRRVLRAGGRVALAAWSSARENPWNSAPVRELIAQGRYEPPDPGAPGQFAWAREGVVAERLEAAGFVEYEVEHLTFTMRYASPEDWMRSTRDTSMRFADLFAGLDPTGREEVAAMFAALAEPYALEDGSLALPAATWVAAAAA